MSNTENKDEEYKFSYKLDTQNKIKEKKKVLAKQISSMKVNLILILGLIIGIVTLFSRNNIQFLPLTTLSLIFNIILPGVDGMLLVSFVVDAFACNSNILVITQEILLLEVELELLDTKYLMSEEKAHKQFRINQKELKRYYDQNLSQTKYLSQFGIFLIIVGISIIVGSIFLFLREPSNSNTLLLIGCISGILIDFIGAVFITTYTKAVETSIKFHSKLANSNDLLLANLIASRIKDDNNLLNSTLSDIAKNISTYKDKE